MLAPLVAGQFNDSYPPIVDGVAMVALNYAQWLNRKHGTCWVVTVAAPGSVDDPGVPVLRYRSIPLVGRAPYRYGLPALDRRFRARLAEVPFDIVHSHNPFIAGNLALKLARARGIPIVTTFHTKFREDFRRVVRSGRLAHAIARRFTSYYAHVDEVWTVTDATVDVLREYGYTGPVEVMPNGCDLEPPADAAVLRRRLEESCGLAPGDFVMLYVGQLIWQKDLRLVLEALPRLGPGARRLQVLLVGGGSDAAAIQSLVRRSGLTDRVRFAGWVHDRERLMEFYARADLLLFPSRYDMSSLVMQEAAAFRLPGLYSKGATTAFRVRDGENGFLVAGDPAEWAAAIGSLRDRPEAIRRAGNGAFRDFYRSWESIVDEVSLRYRSIIERHRRAGGLHKG